MTLYHLSLKLLSPLGSPLVGPQIFGMVCQLYHDIHGAEQLESWLKTPEKTWRISDGFPENCLPKPFSIPILHDKNNFVVHKKIRKSPWIRRETWLKYRNSWSETKLSVDDFVKDPGLTKKIAHNIIDRHGGKTLERDGLFFVQEDWRFDRNTDNFSYLETTNQKLPRSNYLDLYIEAQEDQDFVFNLISELGQRGYGRDATTGRGLFEVAQINFDTELTNLPGAKRRMSLSRGVYTPSSMQDAYWKIEPHFGRVGPDLTYKAISPFKYPVLLTLPGTSFILEGKVLPGKWVKGIHPERPEICLNGFHLAIPYTEVE